MGTVEHLMFNSKSDPSPQPASTGPHGDAAAASRLTGTASTATATPPRPASAGQAPGGVGTSTGRAGAPDPSTTAPEHHGPGVVKRTTNNFKRALLIVVGALAALFAVFNSQDVQVHWIFGKAVDSPLILVIAIAFVAGAVIGWLAAKLGSRNH